MQTNIYENVQKLFNRTKKPPDNMNKMLIFFRFYLKLRTEDKRFLQQDDIVFAALFAHVLGPYRHLHLADMSFL